jgi:hypothetical protein
MDGVKLTKASLLGQNRRRRPTQET